MPLTLVSFDVPAPRTADYTALELLVTVLADGGSSRLQRVLVDDKKVASGVNLQVGLDRKSVV